MKLIRRALLVALVLALPASAHAASPVLLGPGVQPAVALDPSGTAYISWIGDEPNTTSLHFCRLPRNAANCELTQTLNVAGTSLSRPYVTVHGATVHIYTYRYGLSGPRFSAIYMLTSVDGGASFDPGVQVGTTDFYDAVEGPGAGISFIANNSSIFQRTVDDGSSLTTTEAHLADDHPYTPSVAITPIGLLAVFANGSGNAQFRLQRGGDPNDPATWTPAQDFSTAANYMRLASGPSGTFLLSDDASGTIVIQKLAADGSGFSPPGALPGGVHELTGGSKDITEDSSGRLHAIGPIGDAAGAHIGYATSDDGINWSAGILEAGPAPADLDQAPGAMRVAVAADHLGVVVWQDSASANSVHAMAIGPVAAAPPTIGQTTNAAPVKGTVRVKLKGTRGFTTLQAGQQVPLGSTFDTTKGTVALDTSAGAGKPLQHGEFNGGLFTVQQTRKNPLTTVSLTGGGLGKCGRPLPPGGAPKKRSRTLFSSVRGRFRSRGRNSAATVRGTKWTMTDTCAGTLTTVKQGTVVVRDFRLRKNRTLKSGQHYLARAPRRLQRRGNR